MVNATDRGKATKHSNQRQNVRVPTGATYKGEPRMTIKSDSRRIISLRLKWVKVYLKPTSAHTQKEDRQHVAVALFKIYQGDFLNKPYISLQLRLFFFPQSLRVGSCAAVNGCVCYIRIIRQKKTLSLRYLFCFFKSLANRLTRYSILPQDSALFLSQPAVSPIATATH